MVNGQLLAVVLTWLPKIFFAIVFLLVAFLYFFYRESKSNEANKLTKLISYKSLIVGSIVFRLFYAALLTVSQYYVWSQNKFTQLLLNERGYFLFYSYGRFWLNAFISIGAAFIFYIFLKSLQKHRERFFEAGGTELGFLSALIVGWPSFVIFLPLVFIFVILISISRRIFIKEIYTTLGWPFILATLAALIFGSKLLLFLGLKVISI
jgi:hypothetical protein